MKLLWKLRFILKEYWRQYLLTLLCLQMVSILNLLPPWLIGHVVDGIKDDTLTRAGLNGGIAVIFMSGLAVYGLRYFWRSVLYGASIDLIRKQRSRLFAHLMCLSPGFYQQYTTGELMAHATNDLTAVEESVGVGMVTLVDSLVVGFTVLFAMVFLVSGSLTLLAMLPIALLMWLITCYGAALYIRFGKAQAAFANLNEESRESIAGIRTIRAHQLSIARTEQFERISVGVVDVNRRVARVDGLFEPSINFFFGCSLLLTLGGGCWLISLDQLTVGLLTSFFLYLNQMLGLLTQFCWQFNMFQRGSASWGRLETLFRQKPNVTEAANAQEASSDVSLSIDIKSFGYGDKLVLQHIYADIPEGSFFGITGRTGSGKSSLLRLILREFDVPVGSAILLGNVPLQQLKLASLRSKIAWVPQEPMLFSGTIADNIRLSPTGVTMESVVSAAKQAAIHEDIMALKDGYNTLLGENGINLSGGQRQRLSLARALLRNAPVLLLDDSFSALDMKTEAEILKRLMAMRGEKTIILVTQRLPALIFADHILVLDRGRIIEQGNHHQLMAAKPPGVAQSGNWYARIFRQQVKFHSDFMHSQNKGT